MPSAPNNSIGYWKMDAEPDPNPAEKKPQEPAPEKPSWWDMVLPACQRGLPCDDCGMCH